MGVIQTMRWHPDKFSIVPEPQIRFDDDTFIKVFEGLRQAAAAYIKHYGFSVNQKRSFSEVFSLLDAG
jgi:hypothetical protein